MPCGGGYVGSIIHMPHLCSVAVSIVNSSPTLYLINFYYFRQYILHIYRGQTVISILFMVYLKSVNLATQMEK